jgi:hypothetical protein
MQTCGVSSTAVNAPVVAVASTMGEAVIPIATRQALSIITLCDKKKASTNLILGRGYQLR